MANGSIQVVIHFLLVPLISFSSGFDFTLEHIETDSLAVDQARQVCGIAKCVETLPDLKLSGTASNHSRRLTSLNVYKARLSTDGTGGHWQQLVSLTPKHPDLNRVSDGMKVTGQLGDQQATVSLELVKAHDCLESQFSCVAVFVDSHGRATVKKSFVGKALSSPFDMDPPFHAVKVSSPSKSPGESLPVSSAALVQMMGVIQAKLDRMDDSIKSIENRLEDKVGEVDSQIDAKLDALDLKLANLQTRLEDKLVHVDTQVTETVDRLRRVELDDTRICDRLTAEIESFGAKQGETQTQLDTCVAEVTKLSKANDKYSQDMSNNLMTLSRSMERMNENLTSLDLDLNRLETATDQCKASDSNGLAGLKTSLSKLSKTTDNLAAEVKVFRTSYSGGALVPVEQFFDLLGTGRKEWRLAFRGTPYIDVRVFPAFMHGTGIPVEVEQGCKQFNRSLPCTNHYRDTEVFDNWAGVDEVLFGIFKDDQMVHRIIFNGKGSSYSTWFTEGRVIDSSWGDLTTKSHLFFSITGDFSATTHRRFYVSYDHDNGCNGFRGWFLAGDTTVGCPVENTVSSPTFFYATGTTFTVWPSSTTGQADAIGIFIKYE